MSSIAQALADKDFLAAKPQEQIDYLSSIDPDFKNAKPEEQAAYMLHVLPQRPASDYGKPIQSTSQVGPQPSFFSNVRNRMQQPSFLQMFNPATLAQPLSAVAGAIQDRLRQSPAKVPGTGVTVGQATQNAQDWANMAGTEANVLSLPMLGETAVGAGQAIREGMASEQVGNRIASALRNPATARQSQLGRPGSVKQILPPSMQRWTVPDWMIPKGDVGTPTNPGPFMEIPGRMPKPAAIPEPVDPVAAAVKSRTAAWLPARIKPQAPPETPPASPFAGMTPSAGPGVPKGPATLFPPAATSRNVTAPMQPTFVSKFEAPAQQPTPFTAQPEAQSAEGIPSSVPKPSGRLVVLPQEAQALEQMQKIATKRASEHGMQYAAGMRPAGGGRVPMTPTKISTMEFPGPRSEAMPLKMETDSLGIRWAVSPDGSSRVSIPKNVPDEAAEAYARPKLAEQSQIRSMLPWMRGQQ
jgi:hypothetical protein